ncbi:TetR/AcrR family transcriptional regulator [Jannaschia aquimarina]|uniref:YxaF protein n=1 Tax=Jannaschia aquimarina TaxID=935700 RepID=A0A0D1D2X3_9RHOB|nr:TetR/AcrR family transcriptional regulator [Jannaschia aquimarina]KIT14453.1 putative HTH-type transcriptional regulator YxaF [Jannaschia aquimarina]SNT29171.1 transcriptional regulator, TetR family [Jannaschia aquimarina]
MSETQDPPPRSLTTPEKLIAAASQLFRVRGYAGTGIAEILKAAGVPKGSLYHHFPGGKEDLALACADVGGKVMLRMLDRAMADAETLEEALDVFAAGMERAFARHGDWRGCPVTSTLIDGGGPPKFAERARSIFADWEAAFADHYARLGASDPAALARASLTVVQGAWAQARAHDDAARMRDVAPILKALARNEMGRPKAPRIRSLP